MKRILRAFLILSLSCLLSACGFHLRNKSELPVKLNPIYFAAENPYNQVASELQTMLNSMGIRMVNDPNHARYTLHISKTTSTHSQANLSDTSRASTLTYRQKVMVSIKDNKTKKTLVSRQFSASVSQYLNQNQIMTANTSALASQSLPHDIVTHIYIWLTTDKVKNALNPTKQKK